MMSSTTKTAQDQCIRARFMPTCDKKIRTMGLVYIINQWIFHCRVRGLKFKPQWRRDSYFFVFLTRTKNDRNISKNSCENHNNCSKEQRSLLFYHYLWCKQVPLCLFSYQMLASNLTTDEQSIYYKVYAEHTHYTYINWPPTNTKQNILI